MHEVADNELLLEYARRNSEDAFAALVTRHVNMVYSVALRKTGNVHAAEEVTQAVFIILARKANRLSRHVVLTGWLYQAARLTASNFLRGEIRRTYREQEAFMQSLANEPASSLWPQIAPLLEDAMGELAEKERNAVALRFFAGKSFAEIAVAMNATENAAKKRVARALEHLQRYFHKRGVSSSVETISHTISTLSIQPAPALLAKAVTAAALAKGASASISTLTLIKGALKIMAWTKAKTAIVMAAVVVFAAGTTTVTVKEIQRHDEDAKWDLGQVNSRILDKAPHIVRIVPTKFPNTGGWVSSNYRILGMAGDIRTLIDAGYGGYFNRTIFLAPVPSGKYDFIANLPKNSREGLKKEIQRQFGLVGRTATVETNVLFLKVKQPGGAGLVKSNVRNGGWSSNRNKGEANFSNSQANAIAGIAESMFDIPVVDQTGLKDRYDIDLKWDDNNDTDHQNFKQALLDHLGLELVSGTAPVEYLFIEKMK